MTKAEFIASIRAACNAYESDSPGPVIPPVIVPPGTGGVFDIFNRLQAKAPEYVAWRYVMQTPSGPLQAALIAQMGANGYANKLAWTGGQPQAPIYEGAIYCSIRIGPALRPSTSCNPAICTKVSNHETTDLILLWYIGISRRVCEYAHLSDPLPDGCAEALYAPCCVAGHAKPRRCRRPLYEHAGGLPSGPEWIRA